MNGNNDDNMISSSWRDEEIRDLLVWHWNSPAYPGDIKQAHLLHLSPPHSSHLWHVLQWANPHLILSISVNWAVCRFHHDDKDIYFFSFLNFEFIWGYVNRTKGLKEYGVEFSLLTDRMEGCCVDDDELKSFAILSNSHRVALLNSPFQACVSFPTAEWANVISKLVDQFLDVGESAENAVTRRLIV